MDLLSRVLVESPGRASDLALVRIGFFGSWGLGPFGEADGVVLGSTIRLG